MKEGRRVVLLTGATGFIGRHLAPVLRHEGWIVRRVVRTAPLGSDDVLVPTIDAETDWDAALLDVDAVVHLAARVHHRETDSDHLYHSLNRDGSVRLAQCAAKAGIGHFIFMSTVLVNGRRTDGHAPFRENDPPAPTGLYALSKADAERGLALISETTGLKITVIRPPLVYGPSALGNFRRLLAAVRAGLPLPFAGIRNRRAFVAIESLVSFIALRLGKPEQPFDVFLIADDEQVSTPELTRRIAKACGGRARLFPLPESILTLLFKIAGRPELCESLLGSMEIDISKARKTGWKPKVNLDQALLFAVQDAPTELASGKP
jgi:UDP-glucose 4-epimerase